MKRGGKNNMAKFDDVFEEKNKNALLEEMAESINSINSLIAAATQAGPTENPAHEASLLKNYLIALAQNVGSLTSCYNQYIVFDTGAIQEEKLIGFNSMLNEEK